MFSRWYLAAIDAVVSDIAQNGNSDYSEWAEITIAGDSVAPAAPSASATAKTNSILLTMTPPSLDEDGTSCVDFKEYGVYHSTSSSIDITDSETYDGLLVVAGGKTDNTEYPFPSIALTYFVVVAFDESGNRSSASAEVNATPLAVEQVNPNLVPNPFFEIDANGDTVPDNWTLDTGWARNTSAYFGTYSIRGQGSAISATSDKVELPYSARDLLVSGMAKTSGTSFAISETTNAATTSAPIAFVDASGDIAAIARQNAGYDIIELWDVSDADSPSYLGAIDESGDTEHRSKPFKIYGDYLICGQKDSNHLYIYDISAPTAPVEIEDYTLAETTGRLAVLAVRSWVVYACCDDDTEGGFIEVVDISSPTNATQLDQIDDASHVNTDFLRATALNDLLLITGDYTLGKIVPDGHSDPESGWSNEANAYDGNTGTHATSSATDNGEWTEFIHLALSGSLTCSSVWFYGDAGGLSEEVDVDVYRDGEWVDVYSGSFDDEAWVEKTFTAGVVTEARIRFNVATTPSGTAELYEFAFGSASHRLWCYDISDPTNISQDDTYDQAGLLHVVAQGDYAYCSCDSGTDQDKIVVLDISTPSSISRSTAVGGSGASNYTGSDALFISNGYLVNVGTGSDAAKYSVSFWDISTPATPTLESVGYTMVGDLDAADETGGLIVGVDIDNSKLRIVNPAIAADWAFKINFYDSGNMLIDTLTVYDGDGETPFTGESWTAFSKVVPEADIPNGASQIDFECYCNESTGYVYVDNLCAEFDI